MNAMITMLMVVVVSAILYYFTWSIPRFGRLITLALVILQVAYFSYAIYPTTSFYMQLIERNSGVKFAKGVNIRWGWASDAFAFPNIFDDRAIDVLVESEGVHIDKKMASKDCLIDSAKVRELYGSNEMAYCWKGKSKSGRDAVKIGMSADSRLLYYRQR